MAKLTKQEKQEMVNAYNNFILILEFMRCDESKLNKVIDGYEICLACVEKLHEYGIINNIELCRLADRLHMCIDCPSTHCVPLSALSVSLT